MYRDEAYAILSKELNRWKNRSTDEIIAEAESTISKKIKTKDEEEIEIELTSKWTNETKKIIRVEAIAYGPSHWKLERLEEKITIDLSKTK